jgi:hypothetical protein
MAGSMAPKTPSRANTKPARARRTRCAGAEITNASRNAAPRCRRSSAGATRAQSPPRAAWRQNPAGSRKTADRFHQIAIGFRIARNRAAERGNDIERIEVVEPVEAWNIDGGEFEAKEFAADLEHAKSLGQRHFDPRHVADAEGDGHGVEAAIRKRQRLGIGFGERDKSRPARGPRSRPIASMSGLISQTVARVSSPPAVDHAQRDVAGAAGDVESANGRFFGGLTAVTSASFQARCSPNDIRSFIRS